MKERLLSKRRLNGDCLEYNGSCTDGGYGLIMITLSPKNYKQMLVHRVAYEVFKVPFNAKLCVLHTCDNPPCFNPKHLFLGTRKTNMVDCKNKGRRPHGSKHHNSKIEESEIETIFELRKQGALLREIASIFEVKHHVVSLILNRKLWKHVSIEWSRTLKRKHDKE